ncbi:MAG: hypothetical protein RLZZ93_1212 [Actinomycetota bacterium]
MTSMPWLRASRGLAMVTGEPFTRIWPESAGCAPAMVCISVDLPAPLPPTTAMTSPGISVSDTPSTAWRPPNDTLMSRSSTSGVPAGACVWFIVASCVIGGLSG